MGWNHMALNLLTRMKKWSGPARKDVFCHGLISPWQNSPYGHLFACLTDRSVVGPVGAGAVRLDIAAVSLGAWNSHAGT